MMGTADEKSGDGRPEPDGFTSQVFANYEVAQEGSVHGGEKKAALAFTSSPTVQPVDDQTRPTEKNKEKLELLPGGS